jgi:hypothetical protein
MWMRVDDGLPTHRKTRAVLKSHPDKTRDAAPLGIWALAGAWAGKNRTDGWVPEDELDRWDDDWQPLVDRLVKAGFWWPHERDGEPGYGFNDWHDYNDPADAASKAGTFGNHVRWHVNEKKVDPECEHCPKEPETVDDRPDIGGRSGGDSQPESGGESQLPSGAIALPLPEPPPEPEPLPPTAGRGEAANRLALVADAPTAQTLVAEWIEHCDSRPPGRVVGQVAKELKALLDEGIEPQRVRAALAEWNRKGLHPSTLASVVHEITNRRPTAPRGQQATNDLFDAAMERALERDRNVR